MQDVTSGDAVLYIRDVEIRNGSFENLKQAVVIEGLSDDAKISNITIADCDFKNTKDKGVITNAADIRLVNVSGLKDERAR